MTQFIVRPLAVAAGLATCTLTLTLALGGCNSGGDSNASSSTGSNTVSGTGSNAGSTSGNPNTTVPSSNATGVFLDAPVQGLRVERSSGGSTSTGALGEFPYTAGESVTFYLGALKLGTVVAKAEITPLDLFGTSDSNNRKVVNLLRLLQALDSNDNLSNGIQLTDASIQAAAASLGKLSLDQDPTLFEKSADVAAILAKQRPGLALPSIADAQAHFAATRLAATGAGLFSGTLTFKGQALSTSGMAGVMGVYNGSYTTADNKRYTVLLDSRSGTSARLQVFSSQAQAVGGSTINIPDVQEESGTLAVGASEIRFSGANGSSLVLSKTAAAALTGVKGFYTGTGVGAATMCPNGVFSATLPAGYGVQARQYVGLAYLGSAGLQFALKPLASFGADETVSGALKLNDTSLELTLPGGKLSIGKVTDSVGLMLDICSMS